MTEGKPIECLLHAIQELWSGCIDVKDGEEPIGQIVLSEGRVAWATCRGQSETLGIFLWRLGRINREQLSKVQEIYQENQGKKKLGVILEETGFMSRPVLRRCLLLHTRSAIEGILAHPDALAQMLNGAQKTDERILFGPEEVLPQDVTTDLISEWMSPDNTLVRGWHKRSAQNAILTHLIALPGHLASAVLSFDGGVVTAFVEKEGLDLNILAVYVAAVLESSSRAVSTTPLDSFDSTMLECAGGWMAARWLDAARHHIIFVLVNQNGNPALVRHVMKWITPRLQYWLTHRDMQDSQAAEACASPFPVLPQPGLLHENETPSRIIAESTLEPSSEILREWRLRAEGKPDVSNGEPSSMLEALIRLKHKSE